MIPRGSHLGVTRRLLLAASAAWIGPLPARRLALAAETPTLTRAQPELSNSITASRDTNVSPKEIYDFLRSEKSLRPEAIVQRSGINRVGRALDLGAGAGVSTSVLWDAGWETVVAVDPSRLAWDKYTSILPSGVTFHQASDEQFVSWWLASEPQPQRFDLIVLNYAVNKEKASQLAEQLLTAPGRLLAPINLADNYWFDQKYLLLDAKGNTQWERRTLGAYDVLFQPDYTAPTCQGQWCPKLRAPADAASLSV